MGKNTVEPKYWFINYFFFKPPSPLDPKDRGMQGMSCEVLKVHPFEFLKSQREAGIQTNIHTFFPVTKKEYEMFCEAIGKSIN
jgi:hypothetical protein